MCYETNLTDARCNIIAEFIEDGRQSKIQFANYHKCHCLCRQNRLRVAVFAE